MINNFDKFKFERVEGEFYYFSIIKRAKDNLGVRGINGNNSCRIIREYSIRSQEDLEKRKQEMIDIATITNARIYMHPARRSEADIKKLMCLLIGEHIALGRHGLSGMYRHACGLSKGTDKLWIVDVDNDLGIDVNELKIEIENIRPNKGIYHILETKNGFHIISHPFDLDIFKTRHPNIDVHKNNPTLIFTP